ncbi:hypothetical protein K2Y11_10445 [bacterium]|nr:hypothetical protein [bacterium]
MNTFAFVLSATLLFIQAAPEEVEEKVPTPEEVEANSTKPPEPSTPLPPSPAKEGETVTDAEKGRIEAMLSRFAGMKLKGQSFEQTFRTHLPGPGAEDQKPSEQAQDPPPANEGPHEFGFRATLPSDEKVFVTKLLSAETLGPKRYRLALELTVPFESIGGYYRFDGGGFLPVPVGWRIDQLKATAVVHATIDFAWKQLPSGNIGIYPGGFLDNDLTEEERKQAKLLEDLQIDVTNLDLSHINLEGINGRRVFIRDGQGMGRGGLLRMALASGQREQIEQMIAGGMNNFIRSNQENLLGGLNNAFQTTLPETQLQITSFVEKLAVQANLSGKKGTPPKEPNLFDSIQKKPTLPPKPNPPQSLPEKLPSPEK